MPSQGVKDNGLACCSPGARRVVYDLVAKPPLTDLGWCFPGGASRKELLANAGDMEDKGLIPWLGRSLGEGHSNPLQYSWLENP